MDPKPAIQWLKGDMQVGRWPLPKPNDIGPRVDALFHPAADANLFALIRRTTYEYIDLAPSSALLVRYDESDQSGNRRTCFLRRFEGGQGVSRLRPFPC